MSEQQSVLTEEETIVFDDLARLSKEMQERSARAISHPEELIDGEEFFAEMDRKYDLA